MITEPVYMKDGKYMSAQTFYGLSTDTKPTSCGNGSIFIEIDTGSGFFFDAENSTWYPEIETPEDDNTEVENTEGEGT